jgi:hypothetical protein
VLEGSRCRVTKQLYVFLRQKIKCILDADIKRVIIILMHILRPKNREQLQRRSGRTGDYIRGRPIQVLTHSSVLTHCHFDVLLRNAQPPATAFFDRSDLVMAKLSGARVLLYSGSDALDVRRQASRTDGCPKNNRDFGRSDRVSVIIKTSQTRSVRRQSLARDRSIFR